MTPWERLEGLLRLTWGCSWGASLVCDVLISWPSVSVHQVWVCSLPGVGPVLPWGHHSLHSKLSGPPWACLWQMLGAALPSGMLLAQQGDTAKPRERES